MQTSIKTYTASKKPALTTEFLWHMLALLNSLVSSISPFIHKSNRNVKTAIQKKKMFLKLRNTNKDSSCAAAVAQTKIGWAGSDRSSGRQCCLKVHHTWALKSLRNENEHNPMRLLAAVFGAPRRPSTCRPSSRDTFKRVMSGKLSMRVAILNASWASLKMCDEEWMFFWMDSNTVSSLRTSPATNKGKANQTESHVGEAT